MTWTKKTPNQPGIYWLRCAEGKATVVELRHAWSTTESGVALPYATPEAWFLGWDIPESISDLREPEWFGPLEPPASGEEG